MQSVQAMHEYMLRHLMTLFAITSQTIHVWNVAKVQINIQIYAFNFDIHCKNAFCFLKIITHFYHLIAQMQSLCWNYIDICNAFFVLFSSLISLIFVILRYCDAIACWNHCEEENVSSASQLYLRIFLNENIQKYYFLNDEYVMINWHIKIRLKTELKIRSELALKLYDFVKTSFRLRHIFDLIYHELCRAWLDNAWQTLYNQSILLSYRELLNN